MNTTTASNAFEQALHFLQHHAQNQLEEFSSTQDSQESFNSIAGAPSEHISALENHLNLALPTALKTLLLKMDGAVLTHDKTDFFFLSCPFILDEWWARKEAAASAFADFGPGPYFQAPNSIQSVLWHDGWIPFCKTQEVLYCIDMAPTQLGTRAQVISVNWQTGQIQLECKKLSTFLTRLQKSIQS